MLLVQKTIKPKTLVLHFEQPSHLKDGSRGELRRIPGGRRELRRQIGAEAVIAPGRRMGAMIAAGTVPTGARISSTMLPPRFVPPLRRNVRKIWQCHFAIGDTSKESNFPYKSRETEWRNKGKMCFLGKDAPTRNCRLIIPHLDGGSEERVLSKDDKDLLRGILSLWKLYDWRGSEERVLSKEDEELLRGILALWKLYDWSKSMKEPFRTTTQLFLVLTPYILGKKAKSIVSGVLFDFVRLVFVGRIISLFWMCLFG